MNRALTLLGLGAVLLAGIGLFQLKYEVESRERLLNHLRSDYLEDQKAVRVLKAEWSYLNSPDYLQKLTERYLSLGPTAPSQVIDSLDDLPWRPPGAGRIMPSADLLVPEPRLAPSRKHHTDMVMSDLAGTSAGNDQEHLVETHLASSGEIVGEAGHD